MQSPVNFWAVSLGPPPNGRVIDGQPVLRHELFQIAQTQAKARIPAHAGDDHLRFELAFPKQRRPTRLHGVTLPNPQVQHFRPNRSSIDCWSLLEWSHSMLLHG